MNDKWKSLIELVVNEEEDKAKDLFHEIAVDESRKIYENLIDEEDLADIDEASKEDEAVDEAKDEEVDEAEDTVEEAKDEEVDETKDEVEEDFSRDETADLVADIKADEVGMGEVDDEGDEDPEADAGDMADDMGLDAGEEQMDPEDAERMEDEILDLQTAIDDLRSEFEAMTGDEAPADDEAPVDDMEPEMEPELEPEEEAVAFEGDEKPVEEAKDKDEEVDEAEKVVEYTQKAPAPETSEGGDGSAGPVAGKNDMGGSAGNIAKGSSEEKGAKAASPKVSDAGNKNKPGGKQALSSAPKPVTS